jgi:uncharacterized protein (UPF0261 family)
MVVFVETIPEEFRMRQFHKHNPSVTLMRTNAEENAVIGKVLADKANMATGPTAVFLPLRGLSALDVEGGPFHDPQADQALFAALRDNLDSDKVRLVEIDANINDPVFADAMANELLNMMRGR